MFVRGAVYALGNTAFFRGKFMNRCDWVKLNEPVYVAYHDEEWGIPVTDDRTLFEMLSLEGAQAGLNWLTILKRREGYRTLFANFEVDTVAAYTEAQLEAILLDARIIRNRRKVESIIHNARAVQAIQREFGSFSNYVWSWVDGVQIVNHWQSIQEVPVTTAVSDALSKDLKKRGFKFVGSTTIYAYMQAIGLVWDHIANCHCKIQHDIHVVK